MSGLTILLLGVRKYILSSCGCGCRSCCSPLFLFLLSTNKVGGYKNCSYNSLERKRSSGFRCIFTVFLIKNCKLTYLAALAAASSLAALAAASSLALSISLALAASFSLSRSFLASSLALIRMLN